MRFPGWCAAASAAPAFGLAIFAAFGCAEQRAAADQPAALTGPMAAYGWFPGRWACTTTVLSGTHPPESGKLWVLVDGPRDALQQRFESTIDGKPYRSDETLSYDAKSRSYVRKEIDSNATHVLLLADTPYRPMQIFDGLLTIKTGALYRMRATFGVDPDLHHLHTATAFAAAGSKTFVVSSTGACTKLR